MEEKLKFYKVTITGVILTQDDDSHPDSWDWSADKIYYRYQEMGGDGADVRITLLQDSLDVSESGDDVIRKMTET
jgi:hypothetical protein